MPYGTYCLRQLLRKYSIRLPESQVYFFIFSISSSFFYYKSKPSRTSFNSFADESNFDSQPIEFRKFESAGVIESRSSGMKGTYIKVTNEVVYDELKKLDD